MAWGEERGGQIAFIIFWGGLNFSSISKCLISAGVTFEYTFSVSH